MIVGAVRELSRFPVKSMLGESLPTADVDESGVRGDRRFGLVDVETGKVASAKDPRRWAQLLYSRAEYDGVLLSFTMSDGARVRSDAPDIDAVLSASLGRAVTLADTVPEPTYDYVWEVDGIAPDEVVQGSRTGTTDEGRPVSTMPLAVMAPGTFQDVAPITLMTTGALRTMESHHPHGDWNPARFRSNLLIDVDGDEIAENSWPGRKLGIGNVVLEVTSPAPRCVMTTLAQPGLERDRGILQSVARHNRQEFAGLGLWACLGAYASVVATGQVSVGDEVRLLD